MRMNKIGWHDTHGTAFRNIRENVSDRRDVFIYLGSFRHKNGRIRHCTFHADGIK